MKYKLLALDVDGTLIGADQRVSRETIEALVAAEAAGLRICLATGRSYGETLPVWRQLPLDASREPMVLIGGALVAECHTGRTLSQWPIAHDDVRRFAAALAEAGYSTMAIVDSWRWGVDYYLFKADDAHRLEDLWFSKMKATVRPFPDSSQDEMPDALRMHAVIDPADAATLEADMQRRFAGRLNLHAIEAPNYHVTILEAFSPVADKWAGVHYVAQRYRIGAGQIVTVGDDVNDLPMIRAAGLGVAAPAAKPAVRAAARYFAADGLPAFIRRLVAGETFE